MKMGLTKESKNTDRKIWGGCTTWFEWGAIGQAILLSVREKVNAAPDRLWPELSLGTAGSCRYPEMKKDKN